MYEGVPILSVRKISLDIFEAIPKSIIFNTFDPYY
jgi:hypothetical protein